MTPKQQRFVAEYLIDLNAAAAYRRVYGRSGRTAEVNGSELLRNTEIAAAVERGKAEQLKRADLSAARVLEEARRLAFGSRVALLRCQTVEDFEKLPEDLQALVSEVEVFDANVPGVKDGKTDRVRRVKTWSKSHALELLAKHFRLAGEGDGAGAIAEELLARLERGRARNAARHRERKT